MEKMPYREELEATAVTPAIDTIVSSDWRQGLPTLRGSRWCCANCAPRTRRRSSRC